ncbi:pyridoxal 5'-phosphate synthase glutaminase subunit PdxT [Desulfofundulus thermobenzoicus]|uniref:Pyridoxal 5'-phosphate synthase subunit PdxT n=1 Tax=Desulfofundulus thermobenzoicus TaxID=29376 RepID=A0A6N7ISD1_9FIRM|nr:pyridoxal 5'-phosphate synthase glutaminase subunit PdxT [Desulfofundulus thermobenzoicus]MQL53026.1 pyridoxal 5'-phosphate synthase glutaminase subunit PdxT [Desulfofundulus thermobenzoicus]HHW42986.1 pyridoxal 5'-phosphate synthase glutaminase subunit PdxT [Desulfotomaculum sp.]
MLIGVLALQGAFVEHQKMLAACGVDSRQVRKPHELEGLDGLIIPGGESTTMGKLLLEYDLLEPIKKMGASGFPVFGTCAGLILLAREIKGSDQPRLGFMDMLVERNAFGRQVDSFEEDLVIPVLGERPLRAVFIRAPYIVSVGPEVDVLARYEDKIVLARQGHFLAAAFHPELTRDTRLHQLFLENVKIAQKR